MAKMDGITVDVGCDFKMCKDCAEYNTAMRIYKMLDWAGCDNHFSILSYDKETDTILIDKKQLLKAIQLISPHQPERDIRLIDSNIFCGNIIDDADKTT